MSFSNKKRCLGCGEETENTLDNVRGQFFLCTDCDPTHTEVIFDSEQEEGEKA